MIDQSKSQCCSNVVWIAPGFDLEQDDCDAEDSHPVEDKQQPPEMGGAA